MVVMIDFSILVAFFPYNSMVSFLLGGSTRDIFASFLWRDQSRWRSPPARPRDPRDWEPLGAGMIRKHRDVDVWRYHLKSWWLDGWWLVGGLMVDGRWLMRSWICWIDDFLNFLMNPPCDSKKKRHLLHFFCVFLSSLQVPMGWHGRPWDAMGFAQCRSILQPFWLQYWPWPDLLDEQTQHEPQMLTSSSIHMRLGFTSTAETKLAHCFLCCGNRQWSSRQPGWPKREIRNPRQQGMPYARSIAWNLFQASQRQSFVVILVK